VDRYLSVLLGGGLGAVVRYVIGTAVGSRYSGRFALGTFLINVTGSFMIGLLMTFFTERFTGHPNWRLFLVTGVLGGYTTFSSFEYEALVASQSGSPVLSFLYVVSSVGFGFAAVWLGSFLMVRR
jgi:CrcB protein